MVNKILKAMPRLIVFDANGFRPKASIPDFPNLPKYQKPKLKHTVVTITAMRYRSDVNGVKNGEAAEDFRLFHKFNRIPLEETEVLYRGLIETKITAIFCGSLF